MNTLLQTLHVLAAVLLVGPLVYAPLNARRGIAERDARRLRSAVRQTALFGLGSAVVGLLGALTLVTSDRYDFATPWVVISVTLYVIALALVFLLALPALRTATRLVRQGVLDTGPGTAPAADAETAAAAATLTATAGELRAKEQLDATTDRVTLAGVLILLAFAAIVVLMVVRPFQA